MKKTKSKPKLKRPVRRIRRSPYGRALEMATRRYEKAVAEHTKCYERLFALEEEIPRLEEMKRVLEGYMKGARPGSALPTASPFQGLSMNPSAPARTPQPPTPLPASIADRVPEHLRRFIPTHPSMMRTNQAQGGVVKANVGGDDEDKFLPDVGGAGVEVLP